MKRVSLVVLCGSLLALVGCHSVHPFASGGYQHESYPVSVATTESGRFVSQDWLVDEWALDANERPVRRQRTYGRQRSDLVLRHRTNQGRMWLDVVRMEAIVRDQELRVLAQQAVSEGNGHAKNLRHGGTLRLVGEESIAIDGHRAHIALVEAGNGQGAARGALVFARANYREVQPRRQRVVPVLIVAGYVNAASDFESGLGDFQRFLASLQLAPSEAGFEVAAESGVSGSGPTQGAGSGPNPGDPAPGPAAEEASEPTELAAPDQPGG